MSLDGAYDDGNIFAKIIRGEMPCVKVWEDDQVLAFMDVFPQSKGHVLVISKTSKARNLLEAETKTLGRLIGAVQRTSRAVDATRSSTKAGALAHPATVTVWTMGS